MLSTGCLDTGVGVVMALAINWLFPRERLVRWRTAFKNKMKRGDSEQQTA